MEANQGESTDESIILDCCNESVFIWDAHGEVKGLQNAIQFKQILFLQIDVYRLRTEYRIVGNCVGCLPSLPRQDQLMGLPMELMPEEVFVLLTKGIAGLGEFKELDSSLDSNITEERNHMHKHSFETQAILFKEERKLQLTRIGDKIIEGKRKKYQQKSEPFDEVKALQEEIDKIPNMSEENMMIQIFTSKHHCFFQLSQYTMFCP